jgi:hypothetical protein
MPEPPAEPAPDRQAMTIRVWDAVCRHIDGMAIGSTMAALSERGVLDMLASADSTEFGKLCAATSANPGFLQVAIRLLADQGWVICSVAGVTVPAPGAERAGGAIEPAPSCRWIYRVAVSHADGSIGRGAWRPVGTNNGTLDDHEGRAADPRAGTLATTRRSGGVVGAVDTLAGGERGDAGGAGELMVAPTAAGRVVFGELAGGYVRAMPLLDVAARIVSGDASADVLVPFLELAGRDWDLAVPAGLGDVSEAADVRRQVLAHLNGHLIAPVMYAQIRGAVLPEGVLSAVLELQNWAGTPEGEIAAALAVQYRYPIVYLSLLRSVPELIFGNPLGGAAGDPSHAASSDEEETHLDRGLDLRFSGEVFAKLCRAPFCEIALPLFDRDPVRDQPSLVLDVGCGDGALLETLYAEVRARTVRGRRLAEYPLLMVGVDPSPVAREMTAARLGKAGIPHLVMAGDIADPDALARKLAAAGHDATDALHVCKSAIHDRAYRSTAASGVTTAPDVQGPGCSGSSPAGPDDIGRPPTTMTAFARPDGAAIDPADLAADLAGLFRAWRSLAGRHGWIVIEAHSAPASTVASLIGRTVATALDATHGYSCQYPVEPEVFMWAARAAGFTSRAHHEPGASALGHTQLTIDHLVPIPFP